MAMELNQNLHLSVFWCLVAVLIAFKLLRTRSKSNLPPSPPKLPIIGNLHQLGTLPHRSFRDLSKKYGHLMLLHLGQTPTLVVSSADLAREMVTSNDVVFSDRASTTGAKIYFYGCKDVGYANYGEEWRQKRKVTVAEVLGSKSVRSLHFIREEEVADLVNKIREACMKNDGSSRSIELVSMLIETANNIMARSVFGHKYKGLDGKIGTIPELGMIMMNHFREFSFGNFFPSLRWMDVITGLVSKMKDASGQFDAFIEQEIEQRKSEKRKNKNKDFVDVLLQLQHDGVLGFDQSSVKAIILDLVASAMETTSTGIEWAMSELMRQPGKMKKVQEEVREVVGNKSRIDLNDVNQMSYMRCVVKETLRLHPPGPLLLQRQINSSVKLGGYDIPPKTTVRVNAWAIHRDPDLWERPDEFIPERFESIEADYKGLDFKFIPFGIGRRICSGLPFAVALFEYKLTNLLYWFDWKLPTGTSAKDIDMTEKFGLVLRKKIPLILHPIPYSFSPKT